MVIDEQEDLRDKPVVIYRSSAGSGKTFTLTQEYLKLAMASPQAYQRILAVTFTNKATDEMKSRILDILRRLAAGERTEMTHALMAALSVNESELQERAKGVLGEILHHYGRFSIVTIDSFFHQVIRSFAREMGLQGTFTIDLDVDRVLQEVIDQMLADVGLEDQQTIRQWLTQFAEERVEDGKSWDFRADITSLASQTLKDVYKLQSEEVLKLSGEKDFFTSFLDRLRLSQQSFENKCRKYCLQALDLMQPYGGVDGYKSKGNGPAGLFKKVLGGSYEITDRRREAAIDHTSWLTKAQEKDAGFSHHVREEVMPVYQAMIEHIDEDLIMYQSLKEVQRYFYTFGILSEINKKLQQYRQDNDVMLIADLPDFLRLIIDESDTPYIYEKVGSFFDHYLIDEFQDTSAFQWTNFRPLVKDAADADKRNLVVGDSKQSIYRWRGGDWHLLEKEIGEVVGEARTESRQLDTNWRSSEVIVQFNNGFFHDMKNAIDQYFGEEAPAFESQIQGVLRLYESVEQKPAKKDGQGHVRFEFLETEENWEKLALARTIALVEEAQLNGYHLRDIAILTRTQGQGKRIADGFMAHKQSPTAREDCKYDVVSSEALYLYSSHAVKMLISLLTWLNHEKNSIAQAEWLYEYRRFVRKEPVSDGQLFAAIDDWKQWVPSTFLRRKEYLKTLPIYELVEVLIRIFGLDKIKSEYTYLQGFQDAILDFSKTQRGDIPVFLNWWENVRKKRAIQIADENDAVKVMTIHKAKGLEFPIVIIPFLDWRLDHDTLQEEILWLPPADHPAVKRLPLVPLKYSGKLKGTFWAEDYIRERASALIDNINLLYVALTRASSALYVFGEHQLEGRKMSDVGMFCHYRLRQLEGWEGEEHVFERGSLPPGDSEATDSLEYGLARYTSESWRGKVSLQMKGSEALSDQDWESQQRGTMLHAQLAEVLDIESHGTIDDDISAIISHPDVRYFFEKTQEVMREVPILLPGGKYYRIDRLVRKDDIWHVIDFKTGKAKPEDEKQVIRYKEILREMGYENLAGKIIYTNPVSVKTV